MGKTKITLVDDVEVASKKLRDYTQFNCMLSDLVFELGGLGYRNPLGKEGSPIIIGDGEGRFVEIYPSTRKNNEWLDWVNIRISDRDNEALEIVRRNCEKKL